MQGNILIAVLIAVIGIGGFLLLQQQQAAQLQAQLRAQEAAEDRDGKGPFAQFFGTVLDVLL